jgi:two-component system chemotaxis sensor kinase CheA
MLHFDATDSDLTLFLEEAAEHLRTLSDGLLRLERDASDPQLIQAMFRAAHTLKGSSATIGHERMARLTHAMESVLDAIRKGALPVSPALIDTLLAGVDALNGLNEEVVTREVSDVDVDLLVARLHALIVPAAGGNPIPGGTTQASASRASRRNSGTRAARAAGKAEAEAEGTVYTVEVAIDPRSDWPAVRAYQALMELAALGTVLRSWPSEEELQSGQSGHRLRAVVTTTRDMATLQAAAAGVSEVLSVTVHPAPIADEAAPATAVPDMSLAVTGALEAPEEETRPIGVSRRDPTDQREDQRERERGKAGVGTRMVRVDIGRLDEMMNLVGELVIDRGRLAQVLRELSGRLSGDPALDSLAEIAQHLGRVSDDLQEQVMLARLLPIENVFNRFPRMVRDLARKSGKQVRFIVEGEQTGLDRSVIDEIGDPLLHLLRNAVDHGVEPPAERRAAGKSPEATVRLAARHEENHIVIEVADDGRGIDPRRVRESAVRKGLLSPEAAARLSDEEAINLIFAPGFSTAERVTDVSGRGVGMDVVRTNIEKIGGSVRVQTQVGAGTTFVITLPLTLAIIRALLVRVGEAVFTIPLSSVQETLRVRTDAIRTVHQREVVLIRGQALPLVRLADLFGGRGRSAEPAASDGRYVVVVRSGRTELGLVVDRLIGEQEVVIKSIGGVLGEVDGIAGATILGDGRVSMIVDVPKVVDRLAARAA